MTSAIIPARTNFFNRASNFPVAGLFRAVLIFALFCPDRHSAGEARYRFTGPVGSAVLDFRGQFGNNAS